jgi:hypothetical protein
LFLVVYDTPGSVTWLRMAVSWSAVGRPGAGGAGGGGWSGSGALKTTGCGWAAEAPLEARDVAPAAAAVIAATAATPVRTGFTVMAVLSIRTYAFAVIVQFT